MFSDFLLRVEDLIKPRTVEYYKRVCWIEGVKNVISKSTRRTT